MSLDVKIQGSADNVYDVSLDAGTDTCSCPAFKYSGEPGDQDCKHLRLLRENIEQALAAARAWIE